MSRVTSFGLALTLAVYAAVGLVVAQTPTPPAPAAPAAPERTLAQCETDVKNLTRAYLAEQREAGLWKARYAAVAEQFEDARAAARPTPPSPKPPEPKP